jgi:hypothetical protein
MRWRAAGGTMLQSGRGKEDTMLNVKALTWAFALTAALVFSVCVAYGLMVPP